MRFQVECPHHWSTWVPKTKKSRPEDQPTEDDIQEDEPFHSNLHTLLDADNKEKDLRENLLESLLMMVARGTVALHRAMREVIASRNMQTFKAKATHIGIKPLRTRYVGYLAQVREI